MMKKLLILLVAAMATILTAGTAMAADPVLYFNASDLASGVDSTSWKSLTADSSKDWTFGADVTLEDATSTVPAITNAYRFTGVTGTTGPTWGLDYKSTPDATWELWVKPSDTGDPYQTIFESGANGKGIAIWYTVGTAGDDTGTISFTIDGGSGPTQVDTVSAAIDTTEFRHIVCDFDQDYNDSVDRLKIFVDGVLAADNSSTNPTAIPDWWGTDPSGLGTKSPSAVQDGSLSGLFTGDLAVLRFWQIATPLTDVAVYQLYLQNFVSPVNNGAAAPGDVTLEWVNLDPNTNDSASTYVDVWFGTDSDKASGNYTKVVSVAQDLISYTIPSPGPGIYYWQVDSYLNGDPAVVDYTFPTEPNVVEGLVNTFTNDTAPSVDAGVDMVTWVGEPVQLAPTIVDDGGSAVTTTWTADVPVGVTASFDPSATDAAPAVTFTKVPYTTANIVNASFEDPAIPNNSRRDGDIPGWTSVNGTPSVLNIAFLASIGVYLYGGVTPDGANVAYIPASRSIYQDLTETFQENATYTLSVAVGFDTRYTTEVTYGVQLLAGSVVIAEETGLITDPNNYVSASVDYVYNAADADKVGQPLQIRLVGNDPGVSGTNGTVFFDNVTLTSSPDFPAPTGVSTASLTLTVQDATNSAVSDSMTVDIYDDACSATLNGLNAPGASTDLNSDCTRDIQDLVMMAEGWLNEYAITASQAK